MQFQYGRRAKQTTVTKDIFPKAESHNSFDDYVDEDSHGQKLFFVTGECVILLL